MNKKGFTLVELLAVIAILAILVIIALPNVLSMFNSAKSSTFLTEVQTIYKQSQTEFINDSIKSSGAQNYCDASGSCGSGVTCKALSLTTTKNYCVKMNSEGTITYIGVKDNSFVYGKSNPANIQALTEAGVKDQSKTTFTLGTTTTE